MQPGLSTLSLVNWANPRSLRHRLKYLESSSTGKSESQGECGCLLAVVSGFGKILSPLPKLPFLFLGGLRLDDVMVVSRGICISSELLPLSLSCLSKSFGHHFVRVSRGWCSEWIVTAVRLSSRSALWVEMSIADCNRCPLLLPLWTRPPALPKASAVIESKTFLKSSRNMVSEAHLKTSANLRNLSVTETKTKQ